MGITKRSKQHLMQREKKELKLVAFSMKSTGRRSIYCVMAQPTLFTILQRFFFHRSLSLCAACNISSWFSLFRTGPPEHFQIREYSCKTEMESMIQASIISVASNLLV